MASLLFLIASEKYTGPATVALQHAMLLKEAGHDCAFISWPGGTLQREVEQAGIWQSHSLHLPTRATGAFSFFTDILKLRKMLRQWQIDAVFCYRTADHLIATAACTVTSAKRIPVVRFLHHGLQDAGGWLRQLGLKKLLFGKSTRAIISPNASQTCRLFYEKHPEAVYRSPSATQDDVTAIAEQHGFFTTYAAVNAEIFSKDEREKLRVARRQELGFAEDECVIVFPARMKWGRGHFRFVDAFMRAHQACPKLRGLFVGDGEEYEKIMPLIQERGLNQAIVWVKDAGVKFVETIACGDVGFLFDPGSAGTARGALEMMAMGVPVVCSRTGVLAELRGFENNTVTLPQSPVEFVQDKVEPDDTNTVFASAFEWFVQNPGQREIMGNTAARMVATRFSNEALTQKLQTILTSILPSKPER